MADNRGDEIQETSSRVWQQKVRRSEAPALKYECVVFNVTAGNKSEVSKWISDNDVNVLDVSRLSKDDANAHLFKVGVEKKAKDTVLSNHFWPEYVGCRPFFRARKQPNRVTNGE